jgi:four helix bundle protein
MAAKNYRDLIVWQIAIAFAKQVYLLSNQFPADERFSLTSQVRRAAVSIPSNIAEGQGRFSDADFCRFLSIAHGSLREVETQIILAVELGYLESVQITNRLESAEEVGRLINGLVRKLRERRRPE